MTKNNKIFKQTHAMQTKHMNKEKEQHKKSENMHTQIHFTVPFIYPNQRTRTAHFAGS